MKTYRQYKNETQTAYNEISNKYCFWAFGEQQFNEQLAKRDLTRDDVIRDYVGFFGGFMHRDGVPVYKDYVKRTNAELAELLKNADFAYDAILYEMANHEYGLTQNSTDVLNALGLDADDVVNNEILNTAWVKAHKEMMNRDW